MSACLDRYRGRKLASIIGRLPRNPLINTEKMESDTWNLVFGHLLLDSECLGLNVHKRAK